MSATYPPGPHPGSGFARATGGASGRASVPAAGSAGATRAAGRARFLGTPEQSRGLHDGGPAGPGGPGGPGGPPDGPGRYGGAPRRGRRPRWGRIAMVVGAVVVVLALLGGVGAWIYANNLNDELKRTDAFNGIGSQRPAKTVEGAFNILLVGSDSRDPSAALDKAGAWRSDTIILMHVPASHDRAYLVSIPRDLYVPVPQSAGAACDSGQREKINAAFAEGGLPLAVRTVECFSDVRIDNVAAIDFGGFKEVTDALGGVDLKVDRDITSIHKPFRKFKKGVQHMDGATALDWVRQRKQFPDGDFARMRHQQEFLRAIMDKAASTGTLSNPAKLNAFLSSVTKAVTVDKDFSLLDTATQFRHLRGENLHFMTSPNLGGQTIDGQSVVLSDRPKALSLYQAIAADKVADWVASNGKSGTTNGS
ncbi:LCP family protein [Micromonospora zhanjiangensis]|uniref:LCP family protein n=1 Tax=Micromonospora zhanjiangensis TaxID=1522057 RepID=A0ABV8KKS2_9ACTN